MAINKRLFNKVNRLACELKVASHKLDIQIDKKYGFNHSDKDMDEIIDCLDYGNHYISFEEFTKLMDKEFVLGRKTE